MADGSDRYVLSPAATWSRDGDELRVFFDEVLLVRRCPEAMFAWLEAVSDEPLGLPAPRGGNTDAIVRTLLRLRLVVAPFDRSWQSSAWRNQVEYFAALGLDAGAAQERLRAAHVTVLGVGGVGGAVLAELVGAGVGGLTLVDGDRVALENLNRQYLYRRCDVGRAKVDVAREWVRERLPETEPIAAMETITTSEALVPYLREGGFLVVAADRPASLPEVCAQACLERGVSMITGGCGLRVGSSGPLIRPADVPAFLASLQEAKAAAGTAVTPMAASFGPVNTLVGATMGRDLIFGILGVSAGTTSHRIELLGTALTRECGR
ncbi:ThiF family adenylyltransferase [Streptomyces sp. NPDC001674]|uniref:ThiF family adenylyltransferase n=1 Tax=Streptomyces sp. NPDC001674 TaxID=3154394 RepID=UPI00331973D9